MTEGARFVGSRTLAGLDLVRIDDHAVIENYGRLSRLLGQRYGDAVAALFAEPVLSHSNGSAAARVDWYTALEGPVRNLADLDPASAAELRDRIRALLSGMEAVLRDPEDGPFVAACLNLASSQAVMAIGDQPLLIDWGLLPSGLLGNEAGRARHQAATLGPMAPDGLPMPPIGRADWQARFRPTEPTPRARETMATALRPVRPDVRGNTAPVVALSAVALLLGLSFIPGVLVFPQAPRALSGEARAMQGAWLDSLQRRRDVLASATAFDCPRLRTELPALVPQSPVAVRLPADPAARPQAQAALGSGPAIQGASSPTTVSDPASLVGRLERGTVLILAGNATGSGFFVGNDLVVTNRHVVENATSLRVAGRHVGIVPATLVRTGGEGPLADFALLRVPQQADIRPLTLTGTGRPLSPVVAAGFPGLHLGTDPTFGRLSEGDASAARELAPVFQTGVINHLQRHEDAAVTLVLHSAEIAPGNSGGPLVDYCGRVVGVNSFGRTDDRLPVTARYALGTDGLAAFLSAGGVVTALDPEPCDLQAAPRARPVASADAAPDAPASEVNTTQPPQSAAPPRSAPRLGRDARPPAR